MDDELIDEIERKSIQYIRPWVWSLLGSLMALTAFLLANGIHLGTIANRHIDIIQKERELGIQSKSKLQVDIETLYTLIAKNNKENLEQNKIILQLQKENEILKENSHPPAN